MNSLFMSRTWYTPDKSRTVRNAIEITMDFPDKGLTHMTAWDDSQRGSCGVVMRKEQINWLIAALQDAKEELESR